MLHQVLFFVVLGETVHHTSAKVVRLKETLSVANSEPIGSVTSLQVTKTHSANSHCKKTNLTLHSEQSKLVGYELAPLAPLHVRII